MLSRPWIRGVLFAVALLVAASWGLSGALEYGWARNSLLARLSASFGRPVEARRFSFSLLGGPRLQADSVTVAEDPRFGQEYFLRADQLSVGFLWSALLRGRIEFGTVSLSHPSLNLVRLPDGAWNVESWLPPPSRPIANSYGPPHVAPIASSRHLGRIEIDGGRINFKLGREKLLFALVGVAGSVNQDSSGRWSLDLQAIPMRASVALQDAGVLRLQGTVAGTTARLRPAALSLTWEQASLADSLRLVGGQDEGVRGMLGAELTANIQDDDARAVPVPPAIWNIAGTVRFAGVHRWDLPGRANDPALNLHVAASWSPGSPRVDLTRVELEAPHSHLVASASLDWSHGFVPNLEVAASSIAFEDLVAWRRSFRADSADGVTAEGTVGLQAKVTGWPPQIERVNLTGTGAVVHLAQFPAPILVGPTSAALRGDSLVVDPIAVTLPGISVPTNRARQQGANEEGAAVPVGTVRVQATLGPFRPHFGLRDWRYTISISGQTARSQDLLPLAEAFGRPLGKDWNIAGSAALQLTWAGMLRRGTGTLTGTLDVRDLQVTSALLNQPLLLSSAGFELRPAGLHVKIGEARVFGTQWKGTLDRRAGPGAWQFDLSAGRLDIADLDRWLGPRARPGFFQRMFGSSGGQQTRNDLFAGMVAGGRLRIAQLSLSPLHLEKFEATADLHGRALVLRRAQAEFFDGRVSGDFEAQVTAAPVYSFSGQFERVNLSALSSAVPSLEGNLAGLASGELSLGTRGIGRAELLASLAGQGKLQVREPLIRGLDLSPIAFGASEAKAGFEDRYNAAAGSFHVLGSRVRIDDLILSAREAHFELQGTVDATQLDLRARTVQRGVDDAKLDSAPQPDRPTDRPSDREEWLLGGTLVAPRLARQTHVAGNHESLAGTSSGISSASRATHR